MTVEDLSKIDRILLIRLSSLGDILLTTPFIRSLKNQFPAIKIDMIVRKEYADTIKLNPNISQRFYFTRDEEENRELIKKLKDVNYDQIIDLQNNLRSKKITNTLNVKTERFSKNSWNKFLLVNFKINRLRNAPQIPFRYAQTISNFHLD